MNEIDKKELVELVTKALMSSKKTESNFWGEFKEWKDNVDEWRSVVHDAIKDIQSTGKATDVKVGIQNGRVTKSEGKIEALQKLVYMGLGGLGALQLIISLIK